MRNALIFLALSLSAMSLAQSDTTSLFNSVVPDITVLVHKHPTGADLVEMTARAEGYPEELLRQQIHALGQYLHSAPRGIDVGQYSPDRANPSLHFTKGNFAIDGVIDRSKSGVRINPFVQAVAGAPAPWTVKGVVIQFQGEYPTSEMPRRWPSKYVPGEGRFDGGNNSMLTGVEYRITLLSQDAAKFDVPEPGQKPVEGEKAQKQTNSLDWTSIAVFLVAAIAVGGLVYSLLLKVRPKAIR